jgi:hypothetical protein
MKIAYVPRAFRESSLTIIEQANVICAEYAAAGYSLTLRQLYYQFVARAMIPNRDSEYDRLGSIVNDARLAGLLDWDYIVDRTREMREDPHWDSPETVIEAVAQQYRNQKWAAQPVRMEAWIEKEALADVIARPARALDIPRFACRGYNSQSNAWSASQRIIGYFRGGADRVVILHLGDHDPSGIDMSRDIADRFDLFLRHHNRSYADHFEIRRIALNMDQVEQYSPPPNPAKMTDSRVGSYLERFGDQSWELDALDPPTIDALIRAEVEKERDSSLWDAAVEKEREERELLVLASERWAEVAAFLRDGAP